MKNYKMITETELLNMENDYKHDKNIPRDRYVAKTSKNTFLALDNSTNECWVDEFNSMVLVEDFFTGNNYDSDYIRNEAIRGNNYYY